MKIKQFLEKYTHAIWLQVLVLVAALWGLALLTGTSFEAVDKTSSISLKGEESQAISLTDEEKSDALDELFTESSGAFGNWDEFSDLPKVSAPAATSKPSNSGGGSNKPSNQESAEPSVEPSQPVESSEESSQPATPPASSLEPSAEPSAEPSQPAESSEPVAPGPGEGEVVTSGGTTPGDAVDLGSDITDGGPTPANPDAPEPEQPDSPAEAASVDSPQG